MKTISAQKIKEFWNSFDEASVYPSGRLNKVLAKRLKLKKSGGKMIMYSTPKESSFISKIS